MQNSLYLNLFSKSTTVNLKYDECYHIKQEYHCG